MLMIVILYMALGYWATGKTIYANKIVIYNKFGDLFIQRMVWGAVGGWILIPVAVIKSITER